MWTTLVLLALVGFGVVVTSPVMASPLLSSPEDQSPKVDIDGRKNTVALVISKFLIGLIPDENVRDLLNDIVAVFLQEDFDYWGEVKDEVMTLVGSSINEHNMQQVEAYQRDLTTLMDRYNSAPVHSDNYPDKNEQAVALSTSIISHRYLTEAALMPQSMILHFEDISSIHIIVLKDVAETYSSPGVPPSRWWVDLNDELDHYITYGEQLQRDLKTWRMEQVVCEEHYAEPSCTNWEWAGTECFDDFVARDLVTAESSSCRQVHGSSTCSTHCSTFYLHKQREVDVFQDAKIRPVTDAWKQLKELAEENAEIASKLYDPTKLKFGNKS